MAGMFYIPTEKQDEMWICPKLSDLSGTKLAATKDSSVSMSFGIKEGVQKQKCCKSKSIKKYTA